MSEPPSKRLFERAGLGGQAHPPDKSMSMTEYNKRVDDREIKHEAGWALTSVEKQEPMIPGFEDQAPQPEPKGRQIQDLEAELGERAADFEYEKPGEYFNAKTHERFVETPGTAGGVLYEPDVEVF